MPPRRLPDRRALAAAALLALAASGDTGAPAPPPELDEMRPWLDRRLAGAAGVTRLRYGARTGLLFAIDPAAGRIHLIDEVFRHSELTLCLATSTGQPSQWQGSCGGREAEIHRGFVEIPGAVDVAVDEEGLAAWAAGEGGQLYRIELDLMAGPTEGWLKATAAAETGLEIRSLAWADGSLWASTDDRVVRLEDGEIVEEIAADGATLLSGEGGLWYATPGALHRPDAEAPAAAEIAAAAGGRAVWWSDGALRWSDGSEVAFAEVPRALAIDPVSGVAWALEGGALHRVAPTGQRAERPDNGLNLLVTATHDAVLADEISLSVYVDEAALWSEDLPPLYLVHTTFLEHPVNLDELIVCSDSPTGDDMATYRENARRNQAALVDIPGIFAVGITPRVAEALERCGMADEAELWEDPSFAPGVLFHQELSTECLAGELQFEERYRWLEGLGLEYSWFSALHVENSSCLDGIKQMREHGVTRQLFFSASLYPDVDPFSPVAKQPWPLYPGDSAAAFTVRTDDELARAVLPAALLGGCAAEPPGVTLYPGNTVRAFSAATCAGLLYAECFAQFGDIAVIKAEDAQVLSLLARHAAARRQAGGVYTWSWHLPDLHRWDYTAGCEREGEEWSGLCAIQQIEALAADLQVLVDAGVAEWSSPAALPRP